MLDEMRGFENGQAIEVIIRLKIGIDVYDPCSRSLLLLSLNPIVHQLDFYKPSGLPIQTT